MSNVRVFWTVEMAEKTKLDGTEYGTDIAALELVTNLRALDDPAYRPVALVKHEVVVTETVTRMSLEPTSKEIMQKVKAKLLKHSGRVPQGEDSLEWAVQATMEALNE